MHIVEREREEYKNLQDLNRSVHNPKNDVYSVQSKYINNQNRKEKKLKTKYLN